MKELVGGPAKQILSRTSPLSQFLICRCFFDNFLSRIFIMTTMTTDDIAIQGHDNLMRKSVMDIKDKSFNYSIIKNSDRAFSCQKAHNNKQGRCLKHGKNSLRSSFSCMRCFHVCIVNVTSSTNFPLVNRL